MKKELFKICNINTDKGFLEKLACQSHIYVLLVSSILLLLTGIVDHYVLNDISLSPLYIIPIAMYAWSADNKRCVLLFDIATAVVSSDLMLYSITSNPPHIFIYFWNLFISAVLYIPASLLIIKLKEAYFKEKNLARIDHITDIANWTAFSEILEREVERSKRYNQPISIVYIDCDNFKLLNDTLGHSTGDKALKIIASTISNNIRKIDLVARLGGDEFSIILTNAAESEALGVINKLNAILLKEMQNNNLPITFSIGIATFNSLTDSIEEMVNQSDKLMYQIKNSTKNGIKQEIY